MYRWGTIEGPGMRESTGVYLPLPKLDLTAELDMLSAGTKSRDRLAWAQSWLTLE